MNIGLKDVLLLSPPSYHVSNLFVVVVFICCSKD